ncbi:hypothetical protein [Nostoc sp.]
MSGAWQALEEAVKIDGSPKAVAKLFSWLTREDAIATLMIDNTVHLDLI